MVVNGSTTQQQVKVRLVARTADLLSTAHGGWQVPLTILHNASSPHGFASFLAAASTLRWRARVGALGAAAEGAAAGGATAEAGAAAAEGGTEAARLSYAVHNHPLPLTEREELRVKPLPRTA